MRNQEYLREMVKEAKWKENISFKTIAEELLDMNYNSFINFVDGYKNLGKEREKILEDFLVNMLDK